MRIFRKNNKLPVKKEGGEFISGIEYIIKRTLNNGINNIFLEDNIAKSMPEIPAVSPLSVEYNLDFLWTEVYSLSATNRRTSVFAYDISFFNYTRLEEYFVKNEALTGGTVLFLFKKQGLKKFSFDFKSVFPVYNYYKVSNFIDYIPYYFELSEKLKLPVVVYLNDSVMNEYILEEKKEYTERTASRPDFTLKNLTDAYSKNTGEEKGLLQNIQSFKNTGKHIAFFKKSSESSAENSLIFTDAKNFHRIIENKKFSENSDIILFYLINPINYFELNEIIKANCGGFYKNIYIFDSYSLLNFQLINIIENNKNIIKYEHLSVVEDKNNSGIELGFCSDDFEIKDSKTPKSFCVGCNLFSLLTYLEKKIGNSENDVLIGENGCFSLLQSSALKFSFNNIAINDNPIFFSYTMNSKDLNKNFYVFISSLKFYENIDKFLKIYNGAKTNGRILFIVYKSILDYDFNTENLILNPALKSIKKIIIKKGSGFKDLNIASDSTQLIFIDNDCFNNAKSGRDLNYKSYLIINNAVCKKFDCRLCYQKTKCPAIKIDINKDIFIEPEICNFCKLCIDICPHNAIKSKKRKKIKVKKSLESKINL